MRRALIPPHGSKFPAQKTNRRKKEGGKKMENSYLVMISIFFIEFLILIIKFLGLK
jgi:hypothetical protein